MNRILSEALRDLFGDRASTASELLTTKAIYERLADLGVTPQEAFDGMRKAADEDAPKITDDSWWRAYPCIRAFVDGGFPVEVDVDVTGGIAIYLYGHKDRKVWLHVQQDGKTTFVLSENELVIAHGVHGVSTVEGALKFLRGVA